MPHFLDRSGRAGAAADAATTAGAVAPRPGGGRRIGALPARQRRHYREVCGRPGHCRSAARETDAREVAAAPSEKRNIRMAHETFHAGDLTAVIGDNEAYAGRRPGYNGV